MFGKIFLWAVLLSLPGLANFHPISVPEGIYLGEGQYMTSENAGGTYASLAFIFEDGWSISYVRNGELFQYNAIIEFNSRGFFNAIVIKGSQEPIEKGSQEPIEENIFYGEGYCGSLQCHLAVDFDYGSFEETITFYPKENRINRLGSLKTKEKDYQKVVWEEVMFKVDNYETILDLIPAKKNKARMF